MGFHRTIILSIIPFILFKLSNKILYSLKSIMLLFLISFILGRYFILTIITRLSFLNIIFSNKFSYYLKEGFVEGNYRKLILYIPLIFFLIYNKKIYKKCLYFKESISFLLSSNILILLFIFNLNFQRVSYLFSISQIYLIDCIAVSFNKKSSIFLFYILLFIFENILLIWMLRIYKDVLY